MKIHSTTILTVRHNGRVAIGGDGQVTLDTTVVKGDSVKIRPLLGRKVLCGFAGGAADAFGLLERFEAKLKDYPENLTRAATNLATALLRLRSVPFIGQEVLHRAQQVRAKPASLGVRGRESARLDDSGEERLRQVLGIVR